MLIVFAVLHQFVGTVWDFEIEPSMAVAQASPNGSTLGVVATKFDPRLFVRALFAVVAGTYLYKSIKRLIEEI